MTRQALKDKFLEVLQELGGSAGNIRLREALGWAEATYDAVKREQIELGLVTPGRGRGGSVSLASGEEPEEPEEQDEPATPPPVPTKLPRANGTEKGGGDLGFEAELFLAADKLRGTWSRRTTSTSSSA